MSDGLKTGLILGGAGLLALFIWRQNASAAALPAAGVGAPAVGSPAAATAAATAAMPAATSSAPAQTFGVNNSTWKAVGYVAASPVIVPTQLVVKGASAAWNGIKSIF
jgi:hypothetical protein